ncbi:MAG: hypothetical protein AAFY83_13390, partial [Pseudomonadota bacterium]
VDTISRFHDVQGEILEQISAGFDTKRISKQTFIREQMNKLVAEAKYDIAVAGLQNAFANVHASMGLNPFGNDVTGEESVVELAGKLQAHWQRRGDNLASVSNNTEKAADTASTSDTNTSTDADAVTIAAAAAE